jgi:15-cis-phytoene synthase
MPMHLSEPLAPVAKAQAPQTDGLQALRQLMRGGSKTFFAASLLLPARVRTPATALYAYCRLADDAIDLGTDPHAEMSRLKQRLDAIYQGRPSGEDADRALCQVVHRFALPRELLDGLLEGFLWDAQGRHYETLAHVQDYGARVAGTVGAMMALVMGTRSPSALARACELGVAMQLTNIARDVGEDARNGRLYLPRQWLREEGLDVAAWLQAPVFNQAIARCTARLLENAEMLYRRAEHGIAELPLDCRPAIQAARRVYAEIGQQIQRQGLDSINRRAVVSVHPSTHWATPRPCRRCSSWSMPWPAVRCNRCWPAPAACPNAASTNAWNGPATSSPGSTPTTRAAAADTLQQTPLHAASMSDTDTLKLIEVGGLLVGGGLVVWWQMRDLKQAQAKTRAERAAQALAESAAQPEQKSAHHPSPAQPSKQPRP